MSQARHKIRHGAEQAAGRLPPLQIAAEQVAATVAQGVHGRRRVGIGETFWQFRRYEPGDPIRSIDWRQSGKTDHIYIRETEWAAAQSVWLWRDPSPSMTYRSSRNLPEKRDRADLLLLALAALLARAGEKIGLLHGSERATQGNMAVDRIAMQLLDQETPPGPPESVPPFRPLSRFSHLVLIGDLLSPLEELESMIRRYAVSGIHGHLVQVLDPAEESLPFAGRTRFEGLEEEGEVLVKRVENVREEYVERMDRHQAGLRDLARSNGWTYYLSRTDHPPEQTLLPLYIALSEIDA